MLKAASFSRTMADPTVFELAVGTHNLVKKKNHASILLQIILKVNYGA